MLWDLIYQFYVLHIFGGYYSGVPYNGTTYYMAEYENGSFNDMVDITNVDFMIKAFDSGDYTYYYDLGSYLSLIATIITMVIIVVLCALFVYKIVKLIGGLIR